MKKVTFFAAALAATALVASPVLAQDSMKKPQAAKHMKTKQMKQHHASKQMKHQARVYRGDRQARVVRTDEMTTRTGFWPADVVGGAIGTAGAIAGTAVGTAGAVAAAPFGGPYYRDSYAYSPGYVDSSYSYNGVAIPMHPSYAARNGFSCQPGTFIKGTRTLCQ